MRNSEASTTDADDTCAMRRFAMNRPISYIDRP
jgi:hypothetical protein